LREIDAVYDERVEKVDGAVIKKQIISQINTEESNDVGVDGGATVMPVRTKGQKDILSRIIYERQSLAPSAIVTHRTITVEKAPPRNFIGKLIHRLLHGEANETQIEKQKIEVTVTNVKKLFDKMSDEEKHQFLVEVLQGLER
jgi:hypothetical protein